MKTYLAGVLIAISFFCCVSMPVYAAEDATKKVLKQGIVGAGTGAIAAGASGGKAGKGALIGAGTGILGNVLLDVLTEGSPAEPTPQQVKRTTRTIDLYQQAYQEGYAAGFRDGYREGLKTKD